MDFQKPGPNKRVCAFFIDSISGGICGGLISEAVGTNVNWLVWAVIVLLKDYFNGQSLGKYLVGIQVVNKNDLPVKPVKTIVRNIFMIIPVFPLIEYVRMLRDKKEGKRTGDNVAKTKVTDLKPERKDVVFLWVSVVLMIILTALQIFIGFIMFKEHPELFMRK